MNNCWMVYLKLASLKNVKRSSSTLKLLPLYFFKTNQSLNEPLNEAKETIRVPESNFWKLNKRIAMPVIISNQKRRN